MAGGVKKNTISAGLRRIQAKFPGTVAAALMTELEIETTEAKRRTPVDTGELKASEHAEGPFFSGRTIKGAIVAGGPAAPYAIYVHEDLEAFHEVGQAKFIESVINESRPHLAGRIARHINLEKL